MNVIFVPGYVYIYYKSLSFYIKKLSGMQVGAVMMQFCAENK